ncbi:MAG TPA: hypothetical protein ENJ37_02895 [Deltaproteobacteria bacterium]|nr:hypothetical protein [Deltaproteobacteria bacterium]
MKKAYFTILFFTVLFGQAAPLRAASPVVQQGPNSAKECAICHYNWIDVFYRMGVGTDIAAYPTEKHVAKEMMCYSCHDGSVVDSRLKVWETSRHKTGVKPSDRVTVPKEFPLDEEGRIQCFTCHSAHGVDTRPGIERTIFLRTSNENSAMCRMCHRDKDRGPEFGSHPVDMEDFEVPRAIIEAGGKLGTTKNRIICQTCHTPHGSTADHFLVIPNSGEGLTHSALCETCHSRKPDMKSRAELSMHSHPVDVKLIDEARLPERWGNGEKPYLSFDGRINCRTCHSPHNGTRGTPLLVESNRASALCTTCHTSKAAVARSEHNLAVSAPREKNIDGRTAGEQGVCSACHLMHKGTAPRMWARRLVRGPGGDLIESQCLSCHSKGAVAGEKTVGLHSHPVGREVEGLDLHTDLPFFTADGVRADAEGKGRITCATCHDPHQWDPLDPSRVARKGEEGDGSTSFLRKPAHRGSSLCIECHRERVSVERTKHDMAVTAPDSRNVLGETPVEGGVCGSCHLPHNGRGPKMWARPVEAVPGADPVSPLCISCHREEGVASEKTVGEHSHPVGDDMSGAAVETELPLFDGSGAKTRPGGEGPLLVSCATCHDAHRWNPADERDRGGRDREGDNLTSFLRTANRDSRICASCHRDRYTKDLAEAAEKGTHPVNVVPEEIDIAAKLKPFDAVAGSGGEIICQSCHRPHNAGDEHMLVARRRDSALCAACHEEKAPVVLSSHNLAERAPDEKNSKGERAAAAGACSACHVAHGGRGPRLWARELGGGEAGGGGAQEGPADLLSPLCLSCHAEGAVAEKKTVGERSHPVGMEMKERRMETSLPLFDASGRATGSGREGIVTCSTCHDPHRFDASDPQRAAAPDEDGDGTTSFLRIKAAGGDRQLCLDCHGDKEAVAGTKHDMAVSAAEAVNVLGETTARSGLCGACHVPHNATGRRLWARSFPWKDAPEKGRAADGVSAAAVERAAPGTGGAVADGEPGPNSELCLSCHIKGGVAAEKTTGAISHPLEEDIEELDVDIDLPLYGAGGERLRSRDSGLVGCSTCHDPHRWSPVDAARRGGADVEGGNADSFLRVENERSELCGLCHADKYTRSRTESMEAGSHPVNVLSDRIDLKDVAGRYGATLGPAGTVICQSCHTPHNAADEKITILGRADGSLCLACHGEKASLVGTRHDMSAAAPEERNALDQRAAEAGPCSACHVPHDGDGSMMWARKLRGGEDRQEMLCLSCHSEGAVAEKKKVGRNSHPLRVDLEELATDTRLPLYTWEGYRSEGGEGGKVVCATCHDPHRWNPEDEADKGGGDDDGDGSTSFLRMRASGDSALCAECHGDKRAVAGTRHDARRAFEDSRNIEGRGPESSGLCGACHLPHNGSDAMMWAREPGTGDDHSTRQCTSCHRDDGIAAEKTVEGVNHPTGADLKGTGMRTRLPLYLAGGARSPLSGSGRVLCSTCHDPHRWNPEDEADKGGDEDGDGSASFLRMRASGDSALCAECHRDKRAVEDTKHDLRLSAAAAKNILGADAGRSGLCGACHIPHGGGPLRLWAVEDVESEADAASRLCLTCHSEGRAGGEKQPGGRSHPVGVPVTDIGLLPRSEGWLSRVIHLLKWPLSEPSVRALPLYDRKGRRVADGTMSCSTCHDPHRYDPADESNRGAVDEDGDGSTSFLRIANSPGSGLCWNCHVDKRPVIMSLHNLEQTAPDEPNAAGQRPGESGVCGACHVPHNATGPALWSRNLVYDGDMGRNLCESCHYEGGPAGDKTVGPRSHPVGVRTSAAMERAGLPLYEKDGARTDDRERGTVTCMTCHNPHQWDPEDMNSPAGASTDAEGDGSTSFLRLRASGISKLCIECHRGKRWVLATEHDLRVTAPDEENVRGETVARSGVCGQCHSPHDAVSERIIWARELGPGEDFMERACLSCHGKGRVASAKIPLRLRHPRDVLMVTTDTIKRRSGHTDIFYPIYDSEGNVRDSGFITCPTCHNPHRWRPAADKYGPGRNTEGKVTNSFLRNLSQLSLCSDCHSMDALFRYKYFHGNISRHEEPKVRFIK